MSVSTIIEILEGLVDESLLLDSPLLRQAWRSAAARVEAGAGRGQARGTAASSDGARPRSPQRAASAQPEPSPEPGAGPVDVDDGSAAWPWARRLARATAAGLSAGERIAGSTAPLRPSPALPGRMADRRVFAVVRPQSAAQRPGILVGPFKDVRPWVEVPATGALAPHALFHGFASLQEAEAYCRAALGVVPERYTPLASAPAPAASSAGRR